MYMFEPSMNNTAFADVRNLKLWFHICLMQQNIEVYYKNEVLYSLLSARNNYRLHLKDIKKYFCKLVVLDCIQCYT